MNEATSAQLSAATPEDEPFGALAGRRATPLASAAAALWLRELRSRMRGKKAFVFITVYLSALAGLLWMGLRTVDAAAYLGALEQMSIGRGIFAGVVLIETLVVVALAPAYTAGSISQEREKQTFDLLSITPISTLSIVVGKLLSGLSYLVLIIGASIPFASLAFLYGGVDVMTLVVAYLILAVAAVGIGMIGILCSAAMRRTQPATVAAFMLVGAIVVGGTAAWGFLTNVAVARDTPPPPEALLYLNPFLAQSDLLCSTTGQLCFSGLTVNADGARGDFIPPDQLALLSGGFWPKSVLAWLLLTVGGALLAGQALTPSRRRPAWRRGGRRTEAR